MNATLKRLWASSAPLTAVGIIMLPAFVASLAGLVLDTTIITGMPAWLKPAKFAISSSIYAFTLAWILIYLKDWPRLKRITGWLSAAVLVVEVGIIDIQAARGTTSHFNVGTVLDGLLFTIMGVAILVLWIAAITITIALFRQRFEDPARGWSLRWGMLITVLGAGLGGAMTTPTSTQLGTGEQIKVSGAHTVGAPDGGPGLPGTGWSTQHGDLRVPHFVGLHALQIVPLLSWFLLRWRRSVVLAQLVGASYLGVWTILTWQAFRGQSVIAPDPLTTWAIGAWIAATIAGLWVARAAPAT